MFDIGCLTFILSRWMVVVLVPAVVDHLEYLPDVGVARVALGTFLELVNLFHLKMLDRPDVRHESHLAPARELAEGAIEGHPVFGDPPVGHRLFRPLEVTEQDGRDLVLLVGHVDLNLVRTVGLEVAGVAPEVDRIHARDESELPLVFRTSLVDVVDVTEPLQVLVCFAVQLEVGFEIGAVVAEVTKVVPAYDYGDFVFARAASVVGQVLRQVVNVVAAVAPADAAREDVPRIGVLGVGRGLAGKLC